MFYANVCDSCHVRTFYWFPYSCKTIIAIFENRRLFTISDRHRQSLIIQRHEVVFLGDSRRRPLSGWVCSDEGMLFSLLCVGHKSMSKAFACPNALLMDWWKGTGLLKQFGTSERAKSPAKRSTCKHTHTQSRRYLL